MVYVEYKITKAFIRKCILNYDCLDETVKFALLTTKNTYELKRTPYNGNFISFNCLKLYERLKEKGYLLGDYDKGFNLNIGGVGVSVYEKSCSVLDLESYGRYLSVFQLAGYHSLDEVENFIERIPKMVQQIKDTEAFVKTNFESVAKSLAEKEQQRIKKSKQVNSCLHKLLDGKGVCFTHKSGASYMDFIIELPHKQTLTFRVHFEKFFKEQDAVLQYIGKTVDFLLDAPVKVQAK